MIAFVTGNTVKSIRRRKGRLELFIGSVTRYINKRQAQIVDSVEQAIADREAAIWVASNEILELSSVKTEVEGL